MNTPVKRTEQTANGLATYSEPTFRTYAPEMIVKNGWVIVTQLCEELVEGRWEGFISIVREEPVR
jgi:hypothetical protein